MFDLVVAINGESYSDMIMIKKNKTTFLKGLKLSDYYIARSLNC